jgi:hypothetical protein
MSMRRMRMKVICSSFSPVLSFSCVSSSSSWSHCLCALAASVLSSTIYMENLSQFSKFTNREKGCSLENLFGSKSSNLFPHRAWSSTIRCSSCGDMRPCLRPGWR